MKAGMLEEEKGLEDEGGEHSELCNVVFVSCLHSFLC